MTLGDDPNGHTHFPGHQCACVAGISLFLCGILAGCAISNGHNGPALLWSPIAPETAASCQYGGLPGRWQHVGQSLAWQTFSQGCQLKDRLSEHGLKLDGEPGRANSTCKLHIMMYGDSLDRFMVQDACAIGNGTLAADALRTYTAAPLNPALSLDACDQQ